MNLAKGINRPERALLRSSEHNNTTMAKQYEYTSLIKIEVPRAQDLRDADGIGKSDAYFVIKFDDENGAPEKLKSHVLDGNLNPVWNSVYYFLVKDSCKNFKIKVMDQDIGLDDNLGHCTVLRAELGQREARNGGWYALENGDDGKVEVFFTEIKLGQAISIPEGSERAYVDLLDVYLERGEDIRGGGMFGKPDPYAKIEFDYEDLDATPCEVQKTPTCNKNRDPEWKCHFYYLIAHKVSKFHVKVYDEDIGLDDSLGSVHIIIPALNTTENRKYAFSNGKGAIQVSTTRVALASMFN